MNQQLSEACHDNSMFKKGYRVRIRKAYADATLERMYFDLQDRAAFLMGDWAWKRSNC